MSADAPRAHCTACKGALYGPVIFCPYCGVRQAAAPAATAAPTPPPVPPLANVVTPTPPLSPPPVPPTVPPPVPPALPTQPAVAKPTPAPAQKPPSVPPPPPPPPRKKRGCLAYFGYFLLALSAFVLYTCFKPNPYAEVESALKKDDLNRAFQAWKDLGTDNQATSEGVQLKVTLRKRLVATSATCEAACDAGCARAYATALDEISADPADREVAAALKRVKTIETYQQRVEAINKEADRNIASAASKWAGLKASAAPKRCLTNAVDDKIAARLTSACEKCRTLANARGCALTLLEAGGALHDGASTTVCSAIVTDADAALNPSVGSTLPTTPPLIPGPTAGNPVGAAVRAAIDAAARAAQEAAHEAARDAEREAQRPRPPTTNAPATAPVTVPTPSATAPAPAASAPPPAARAPSTRVIHKEQPTFPQEALRRGITRGSVRARMSVNAQGHVTDIEILSASPPRVFDRAVRDGLANWRFNVGADGRRHDVEINFNSE